MYRFTYLIETLINGENDLACRNIFRITCNAQCMYTTTPKHKHKIHHQYLVAMSFILLIPFTFCICQFGSTHHRTTLQTPRNFLSYRKLNI